MTHPVSRILSKAADLIEERGWNSVGRNDPKRYCTSVAIDAAAGLLYRGRNHEHGEDHRIDASHVFAEHMGLVYDFVPSLAINAWNDDPTRTQAEVVLMLRTVAGRPEQPSWLASLGAEATRGTVFRATRH